MTDLEKLDITQAIADWREWNRDKGQSMDQPEEGWFAIPQDGYLHGIDVHICEDEDTGEYVAYVYPNYIDSQGYLSTDTLTCLVCIPSTGW